MLFANNTVGALLAFRRQIAICEVVAGKALVTGDPAGVENSKREALEPARVSIVGGHTSGGAYRVVVGKLHVR